MRFYSVDEQAWGRFCDAIPGHEDPHKSTMQIWLAIEPPKPSYHATREMLKWLVEDGLVERVGNGNVGAQYYRTKP